MRKRQSRNQSICLFNGWVEMVDIKLVSDVIEKLYKLWAQRVPWARVQNNQVSCMTLPEQPGLDDLILHRGPVLRGDATKTRGADLENIGKLANGSGDHTITGKNSLVSGLSNLGTGDQALTFGANNQGRGQNGLTGGERNQVGGIDSAVVAGADNAANSTSTFVGAGDQNQVIQPKGAIVAGSQNQVTKPHGFVGAGFQNKVQGEAGAIPGGYQNQANGDFSAVPGGIDNTADGRASLALGAHSKAVHHGTLIWHDALPGNFASIAENECALWGAGGFRLRSDMTGMLGADLPSSSNGWIIACPATEQAKQEEIDGARVLSALANVPVRAYQYPIYRLLRGQRVEIDDAPSSSPGNGQALRNFGPSAEAWNAAFGELLGVKTLKQAVLQTNGEQSLIEIPGIATGDQIGVLMSAVQELIRLVQAQADRIDQLERKPKK